MDWCCQVLLPAEGGICLLLYTFISCDLMLLFGKREFLRPFLSTGCRMTQVESHSEGIAPPFLSMLISLKHKTWLQHQILLWCFFFSSHTPCISFFPACSYSYRPGQALMLITESILGYLDISSAKKKNSTNLFWHILRTRIKGKHVFFSQKSCECSLDQLLIPFWNLL